MFTEMAQAKALTHEALNPNWIMNSICTVGMSITYF